MALPALIIAGIMVATAGTKVATHQSSVPPKVAQVPKHAPTPAATVAPTPAPAKPAAAAPFMTQFEKQQAAAAADSAKTNAWLNRGKQK